MAARYNDPNVCLNHVVICHVAKCFLTFLVSFTPAIDRCISIHPIVNACFLRCFRDPIRVPTIENRVPRIRENYHRIPTVESEKSGPYRVFNIFFKKKPW